MKDVYIIRDTIGRKQCLGTLIVIEDGRLLFNSHLLERGWLNNKKNISCIPARAKAYPLKLEWSSKFQKKLWEAYDVPNRSECKFHSANFWDQLNGCFSPGEARFNIGHDEELDMIYSNDMLEHFMDAMGDDVEARLFVINSRNVV